MRWRASLHPQLPGAEGLAECVPSSGPGLHIEGETVGKGSCEKLEHLPLRLLCLALRVLHSTPGTVFEGLTPHHPLLLAARAVHQTTSIQ